MSQPATPSHTVDSDGTQRYLKDGKLHREDGPALVRTLADGSVQEQWWWEGVSFEGNEGAHPGYGAYLERNALAEKEALEKFFPTQPRDPRLTKID